ncbi:MAG: Hsp20/alpha crystallin family protein [Treponema sp.]|nr:Hsp20/alpha crystallin family protein [Treponema sp.]MCL2250786.1 Hsp20/alpha crystallin family protein [Treponema sp.]
MKGTRNFVDLGNVFDEIFEAARNFQDGFSFKFNPFDSETTGFKSKNPEDYCQEPFNFGKHFFDENTDYYPNYSYPPMNVFMTEDRTLAFEFALAGFDEKDISLSFQGDYMVFSAKINNTGSGFTDADQSPVKEENIRYFKRRLKLKDIEKQKYFVPLDKYAQEKVRALYKNGILRVFIPPKDEPDQSDGIKIEIVKEGS